MSQIVQFSKTTATADDIASLIRGTKQSLGFTGKGCLKIGKSTFTKWIVSEINGSSVIATHPIHGKHVFPR